MNIIGWSDYSPIAYIKAATVTQAPLQPAYVASTSESITLTIPRSENDMGSPITSYKLYVDAGDDFTSEFTLVASYDGQSLEHTTTVDDKLVTGRVYRLKTSTVNEYGDSDFSLEVIIGLGANAPAPSSLVRDYFH
jgi:hypothetical protein